MEGHQDLSILQYNVNKSRSRVMIPLFESEGIEKFDTMAIQEPWRNLYQPTTNNRLNQHFNLHYIDREDTRVCFYINKRIDMASYTVTHRTKDLSTLTLRLPARGGSGQHMVKFVVWLIDDHRRRGVNVELHWVPAHIGIAGNEAADVAAKQATGWKLKRRSRGPLVEIDTDDKAKQATMIKELKSARKQAIRKDILPQWTALWKEETRGRDLFRIESSPRKAILRLHDDLSKEMSTIAVQLRTRKIGLNHFLFGRGVLGFDSPVCSCRQGKQTVEHVLFHCMRHQRQRRGLWLAEKREAKWGEVTLRQVLTDPRSLLKAVQFIKESGLIGQFRAPIMEEDDY